MIFDQIPRVIGTVEVPEGESLKLLPQFYRADLDMAWRLGGDVIRRVLGAFGFNKSWRYTSIDSRVSMLMRGMFPCIPGWHCDDFYRDPKTGQPDLEGVMRDAPSEHVSLIMGNCSRTVFLVSPWHYRDIRTYGDDRPIYQLAHAQLEHELSEGKSGLYTKSVNAGELWHFSPVSWHRGSAADANDWRYFIRITGSNHWEPRNELRTQSQVYMTDLYKGW